MDNYDRNLVLVDGEDNIVGVGKALKTHLKKYLGLHRGFSVFIFNSDAELLLQRRASGKLVFPMRWANSVCSHPFANDLSFVDPVLDVKIHAVKRIEHELGIRDLRIDDLRLVARVLYKINGIEVSSRVMCGEPRSQPIVTFADPDNFNGEHGPEDFGEWEVDYIMVASSDGVCDPNPEEVAEVKYVNVHEFEDIAGASDVSPWLREISALLDIFRL